MATKKTTAVNQTPAEAVEAVGAEPTRLYVITYGTDKIGTTSDKENAFAVAKALATGWGEHLSVREYTSEQRDNLPVKWSDISPVGNVTVIYDFESKK